MIILSHRGYWHHPHEKNTAAAFHRSFSMGFGTEMDVRDGNNTLVIAHDIPTGNEISLAQMLDIYCQYDMSLPLAINIKADGLQPMLCDLLHRYKIRNYFLFDMSVPDHIVSLKHKLTCFTRHSEYENCPLYDPSHGVWMDTFTDDWIHVHSVKKHLQNNKKVCIVSPELHRRKHLDTWHTYADLPRQVMLCTDYPERAKDFFNG